MKALIVGAGLSGLTAAVLLKRKGWTVRVLEQRDHIGGNCWDYVHNGVYVHRYGPHIFHTNNELVWKFVNGFTKFNDYEHKVLAKTYICDQLLPIPYSKATEEVLGRSMSDSEIVDVFFRMYSEKMWGCSYADIPMAITSRVPRRRENSDTRYFTDKYQGLPLAGYFSMFDRMAQELGSGAIELQAAQTAWIKEHESYDLLVFTGKMDEFFDYELGHLPYRAIEFEFRHSRPIEPNAVVNWCDTRPSTRCTDFSRFYPANQVPFTVLCNEYPREWNKHSDIVPSYPMRGFIQADNMIAEYEKLSVPNDVLFCGRLGAYKYMNMDAVIADTISRLEAKLGCTLFA